MQRTITTTELQTLLDKNIPVTLLDVRRNEDRSQEPAAIPGASWHDPAEVKQWSGALTPAQDIVLFCVRGGSVSNLVVDALHEKGLKARFIEGGLEAWKNAGGSLGS